MKKIDEILEELQLNENIQIEEIPNIDLYMDQVIQLFEKNFSNSKRKEEDKVLTKTMINNYAKGKLFYPIEKKKYSKDHIMLISLIYQMKGALSINDIKKVLDGLNNKITEEEFQLDSFYNKYIDLSLKYMDKFQDDILVHEQDAKQAIDKLQEEGSDYLSHILLVTSLVNMSNLYRRVAEKLIDSMENSEENEKK
ncbi:DUF1836 domain-containing protein [Evansella sp. AB-P1]|uniref:DUF1836 domain-containing protein n=1 Tax=Evansella sp. AB-P1 TaxID=3037653 RepID=UPI00241BF0EA|nr:DUF1836 domain-containing protein [Evansella sp. AB-P1]MDG5788958.1 DUF1836 domain-containing protein [Evansella sp. AB-P1]